MQAKAELPKTEWVIAKLEQDKIGMENVS